MFVNKAVRKTVGYMHWHVLPHCAKENFLNPRSMSRKNYDHTLSTVSRNLVLPLFRLFRGARNFRRAWNSASWKQCQSQFTVCVGSLKMTIGGWSSVWSVRRGIMRTVKWLKLKRGMMRIFLGSAESALTDQHESGYLVWYLFFSVIIVMNINEWISISYVIDDIDNVSWRKHFFRTRHIRPPRALRGYTWAKTAAANSKWEWDD